jgi:hypothetical protein
MPRAFLSGMLSVRSMTRSLLLALMAGMSGYASEGTEFFEKRVRPILVERCQECHEEAGKKKGGLALDSRAGWVAGGVWGGGGGGWGGGWGGRRWCRGARRRVD